MKYFFLFLFLSPLYLYSQSSEMALRRIQAHLIVEDFQAAKEEAQSSLLLYPDDPLVYEMYIKALARLGQERIMLETWNIYAEKFPEKKLNRELIEEMCWGVLDKAALSPSLVTRLMAILGAFFSQDSRGIEILRQGLGDSNANIREISVEMASHFRDQKLKNEIKNLYKKEKVWSVRKGVLKAIGSMKIKEMSPQLELLISLDETLAEEKALAISSLIELMDEINREKIEKLVKSNRAGLRLLACEAIAYFRLQRDVDQLMLLSNDYHPEVRAAAIQALGQVRPGDSNNLIIDLAKKRMYDKNAKVALSAAWLLTLYHSNQAKDVFNYYLRQDKDELRLLAASALTATGKYGIDQTVNAMRNCRDPYVCLNLAMGVIGQRQATQEAAQIIHYVVNENKDKWITVEDGIFDYIAPRNSLKAQESSENTPEMENQLIRLQVLNALSLLDPSKAHQSIRNFLLESTWGISGAASVLLLTEGNDASIKLVQDLLLDPNKKVRVQAALILSLWSREENAIAILEQNYCDSDKEMKTRILEGLGRIGSMQSVPFLIDVLKEPSQQLRIIAATALIQSLNH